MFERTDEMAGWIREVYALTQPLGRGGVLTHGAITEVLGVEPHEWPWQGVILGVREILRKERGIETWFVLGVGYSLLTVQQQLVELPIWRKKKQASQARKTRRALTCLATDGLTLHERRVRLAQIVLTESDQKRIRQEKRLLEVLYGAPQPLEVKEL